MADSVAVAGHLPKNLGAQWGPVILNPEPAVQHPALPRSTAGLGLSSISLASTHPMRSPGPLSSPGSGRAPTHTSSQEEKPQPPSPFPVPASNMAAFPWGLGAPSLSVSDSPPSYLRVFLVN